MDYIIFNLLETRIYIYRLIFLQLHRFNVKSRCKFRLCTALCNKVCTKFLTVCRNSHPYFDWWLDGDSSAQKFQHITVCSTKFKFTIINRLTSTQMSLHQVVLLIYICNEISHKTMFFLSLHLFLFQDKGCPKKCTLYHQ